MHQDSPTITLLPPCDTSDKIIKHQLAGEYADAFACIPKEELVKSPKGIHQICKTCLNSNKTPSEWIDVLNCAIHPFGPPNDRLCPDMVPHQKPGNYLFPKILWGRNCKVKLCYFGNCGVTTLKELDKMIKLLIQSLHDALTAYDGDIYLVYRESLEELRNVFLLDAIWEPTPNLKQNLNLRYPYFRYSTFLIPPLSTEFYKYFEELSEYWCYFTDSHYRDGKPPTTYKKEIKEHVSLIQLFRPVLTQLFKNVWEIAPTLSWDIYKDWSPWFDYLRNESEVNIDDQVKMEMKTHKKNGMYLYEYRDRLREEQKTSQKPVNEHLRD